MIKELNTLIINPTYECNYDCTFCSSVDKPIEYINESFLLSWVDRAQRIFNFKEIAVQGGEPLLLKKDFFIKLKNIFPGRIIIQTNGELFYNNPEHWSPIFDSRTKLYTSFQLGDGRKNKAGVILTPELFDKYQEKYKQYLGNYARFIYVIMDNNYSLKHIDQLADIVRKYKVEFNIIPIVYYGRGKDHYIPMYHTPEVFYYIMKNHPDIVKYFTLLNMMIVNDKQTGIMVVSPNGDIYPDPFSEGDESLIIGTIFEDPLYVLSKYKGRTIPIIKSECNTCDHYWMCRGAFDIDLCQDSKEDIDKFCISMDKLCKLIYKLRKKLYGVNK